MQEKPQNRYNGPDIYGGKNPPPPNKGGEGSTKPTVKPSPAPPAKKK